MKRYALIGAKLGHSYSQIIHEEIFKNNNIDATYELMEVALEDLPNVIEQIRNGSLSGINVTIPYKEKILPLLDQVSDDVKEIKACNTVCLKDGKVTGFNTDYLGFKEQLKHQGIKLSKKNVYVLGSGGASKAICHALKTMGIEPVVVSRKGNFKYEDLYKVRKIDIIINATPVGMWPDVDASPLPREIIMKARVVIDVIFNPRKTKLLEIAGQDNNGLPMLVYQAMKSEEIWQGKKIILDYNKIEEVLK